MSANPADQIARENAERDRERAARPYRSDGPLVGITATGIAEPIGTIPYACRALGMLPGRPTFISGYGGTGKTMLLQEMLLSIARGDPTCWGGVPLDVNGPVLHVDFEMGPLVTRLRYQRLATAMGCDLRGLGDNLRLVSFPRMKFDHEQALDELVARCRGVKVAGVDCLRSGWPSLDENASSARAAPDMLATVSSETGTTFVLLHHDGKFSKATGDRPRGQQMRGSSALFDAAGQVLALDNNDGAMRITICKPVLFGAPTQPIHLKFLDEGPIVPEWQMTEGVSVQQMSSEHVAATGARKQERIGEAIVAAARRQVLVTLAQRGPLSKNTLVMLTNGNTEAKRKAVVLLEADGLILETAGPNRSKNFSLTPAGRKEHEDARG